MSGITNGLDTLLLHIACLQDSHDAYVWTWKLTETCTSSGCSACVYFTRFLRDILDETNIRNTTMYKISQSTSGFQFLGFLWKEGSKSSSVTRTESGATRSFHELVCWTIFIEAWILSIHSSGLNSSKATHGRIVFMWTCSEMDHNMGHRRTPILLWTAFQNGMHVRQTYK